MVWSSFHSKPMGGAPPPSDPEPPVFFPHSSMVFYWYKESNSLHVSNSKSMGTDPIEVAQKPQFSSTIEDVNPSHNIHCLSKCLIHMTNLFKKLIFNLNFLFLDTLDKRKVNCPLDIHPTSFWNVAEELPPPAYTKVGGKATTSCCVTTATTFLWTPWKLQSAIVITANEWLTKTSGWAQVNSREQGWGRMRLDRIIMRWVLERDLEFTELPTVNV